jgi:hypothetical protein
MAFLLRYEAGSGHFLTDTWRNEKPVKCAAEFVATVSDKNSMLPV